MESVERFYAGKVLDKAFLQGDNALWNDYDDKRQWRVFEYDADMFAATIIKCPICLKVVIAIGSSLEKEGRMNQEDYKLRLRTLEYCNRCSAQKITLFNLYHLKHLYELQIFYMNIQIFLSQKR